MKNVDINNLMKLTKFELKIQKKLIFGWCISIFGIMFLYMVLFPSIKDLAQAEMEAMPKELLDLFGMGQFSDMGNYITYYGMIYNIILIAISIFATTFGANLLYKEEKSKSIEFLYSLEVSRSEIFFSKLLTGFIGLISVIICAIIPSLICGFMAGDTFDIIDFMKISKMSSFTPFLFLALAFMISGISSKISGPTISSVVVLVSYMMGYLGTLLEDKAQWLKYLSPFESISPSNAIKMEDETMIVMGIYIIIMILFVIIGKTIYKKRDLNL